MPVANAGLTTCRMGNPLERGDDPFPLVSHDHHDLVESGVADLPDRAPHDRLIAKWQQQLLHAHSRGRARRQHDCADHRRHQRTTVAHS